MFEFETAQDGVRLYGETGVYVTDLDIKPGIKEFHFAEGIIYGEYIKNTHIKCGNCCCVRYNIPNSNKKSFPEVETLYIEKSIDSIIIPNSLFPNVKQVISEAPKFASSNVLIRIDTAGNALLNTFYKKEGEQIDLKKVKEIRSHAFEGCESANVINAYDIETCREGAFYGYTGAEDLPAVDGAHMLGDILVESDGMIPKCTKLISKDIDFSTKTVTIFDISLLKGITPNKTPKKVYICNTTRIHPNKIHNLIEHNQNIEYIEITPDNPWYTSQDGIVYTSDMTYLVRCPISMTGKIVIPDGVKIIGAYAFANCCVNEVVIPDSVTEVGPGIFNHSWIKKYTLGKGMSYIGESMFYACRCLDEIKIPSHIKHIKSRAFESVDCSNITIEEGVEEIDERAFVFNTNNDFEVRLPLSIKRLGNCSFANLRHLYVTTKNNRLPYDIFNAIDSYKADMTRVDTYVTIDDEMYIIPYVSADSSYLDSCFKIFPFDKAADGEKLWLQCDKISDTTRRRNFLILIYPLIKDKDVKEKIRKRLKEKQRYSVKRMYETGDYERLVKFLSFDVCTENTLQYLIREANKDGKIDIQSYALEALQRLPKKSKKYSI